MTIKNYNLYSDKLKRNILIALFSDIHYCSIVSKNKLNQIYNNLVENKPDFICITGDIIDSNESLLDKKHMNIFYNWIKQISSIAPTLFVLGNHDILKTKAFFKEDIYTYPTEFISNLNKIPNLYFLDNKGITINNINFYGYSAPYKYYRGFKSSENIDLLIEDFNKNIKIKRDTKNYNVLLFHSPIRIIDDKVLKGIKNLDNIDLILTGHMHNGLVPNFMDKFIPKNMGLVGPYNTFFPKYARGIVKKKGITMVISGAVTKFAKCGPRFLTIFNHLYGSQIEYISIKNSHH